LTRLYAKAPLSTIALDSDQDALRVALIDSPHDMRDKVSFLRAQAEHLPFSKNKFDLAILAWSF
jgi:ubiquinone/menaquinone biosynthesis C-methylase UbiE